MAFVAVISAMHASNLVPLLACVMLSACEPAAVPGEPAPPPANVEAPPPASVPDNGRVAVASGESIAGEWRVAGVGDRSIDQPEGITASITPSRLHLTAGCVNVAWAMTIDTGRAGFRRMPVESCARGLTPTETALVDALDAAISAHRLPSNALVFGGTAGDVTLFTQ